MTDLAPRGDAANRPRTDVAIAIIARGGKVLICQRAEGGSFPGFWEFPGGKREPGETILACLVREIREELAIDVEPVAALTSVDHEYANGRIRLHPYICRCGPSEPQLLASQAADWVLPKDLRGYPFPPANESLIEEAVAHLTSLAAPATERDPSALISGRGQPKLEASGD